MTRPRLLIAGGGPVGLSLACACRGFEVRVIEASSARAPSLAEAFDLRVYALSPGTRNFLREIGAWKSLDAKRLAPVTRMEVAGDGGTSISFNAPPRAALAWIVEASRLTAALEAAAASDSRIAVSWGAAAVSYGAAVEAAWVEFEGGQRFEGDLLVGADGPDSRVRAALGLVSDERAYGETAVVANFETEKAHGNVARQWFRGDGVLAWLPLPAQRISIVWSAPRDVAEELGALDPEAFALRVREAGGAALGDLRLDSGVGRFPLRLIRVPHPVAPGAALVGDAAHAVHPLAGQGVNLGFQDARLLAQVLASRSPLERPGDLAVLRRYARGRREDVGAMQFVTDGLDRLFATRRPGASLLRNAGLALVNSQAWAKRALAERAMR